MIHKSWFICVVTLHITRIFIIVLSKTKFALYGSRPPTRCATTAQFSEVIKIWLNRAAWDLYKVFLINNEIRAVCVTIVFFLRGSSCFSSSI